MTNASSDLRTQLSSEATPAATASNAESRQAVSSAVCASETSNAADSSDASPVEVEVEASSACEAEIGAASLSDPQTPSASTPSLSDSQVASASTPSLSGPQAPSVLPALRGEDISIGYHDRLIISPMNVEIPAGKVTTIIGANGCGKSTLLKGLARILPLRSGAVYLDGKAIAKMPSTEIARQMALLPQSPEAPTGLTVSELVAYGRYPHQRGLGRLTPHDKELIDEALAMTYMSEFADRALDELSGGQRQRAWIAMALAQDTDTILLDEPTTYLDLAHQLEVLELLRKLNREQGKTVALVIHELNLAARYADWMIAMKDGAVSYLGTPDEVMTPKMMRDIFALDALIETDPWSGRPSVVSSRLLRG